MNNYELVIEKLLSYFTGDKFSDEVREAKSYFFDKTAILDEESDNFEQRSSQFLDWYLFSWKIRNINESPIKYAYKLLDKDLTYLSKEELEVLNAYKHGIFEFLKIKNDDIYLRNLYSKEKIIVKKSPWTYGFGKEELFEARLIPVNDTYVFLKGICFYPEEGKKYIKKQVKICRKKNDIELFNELTLRLLKIKYKYEQYRHLRWENVFSNEDLLKI